MEPMECVAVKMGSDDDCAEDEEWKIDNGNHLQSEGTLKYEVGEVDSEDQGGCGLWDTYLFGDRKPYCCVKCGLLTATRRHLSEHIRQDHDGEEVEELDPPNSLNHDISLDLTGHADGTSSKYEYNGYRIAKKQREKRFACDLCNYKAGQPSHLASHKRMHSGSKRFVCDLCGYRTHSASHLRRHKTVHSEEKPYACDICGYRTAQPYNLKYHMRKHSGDKRYACGMCDYRAMDSRCLEKHLRTHTGERPFACDLCDYKATQVCNLVKHKRTHMVDKPFTCPTCDYKCSNAIALASHRLSHVPEGPLVCSRCPFTAERLRDILRHKRLFHAERKLFACDLCEYTTYDSSNAKKHVLTHVAKSQRPYACDSCDYRSSDPGALKKHSRKHTGERPYACHLCEYAANTPRQLQRHCLKHEQENKYVCEDCGFATSKRRQLVRHIARGHSEDEECFVPPVEVTIIDGDEGQVSLQPDIPQREPSPVPEAVFLARPDDREAETPWRQAWDSLVEHAMKRSGLADREQQAANSRVDRRKLTEFPAKKPRRPRESAQPVRVINLPLDWGKFVQNSLDNMNGHRRSDVIYKESS